MDEDKILEELNIAQEKIEENNSKTQQIFHAIAVEEKTKDNKIKDLEVEREAYEQAGKQAVTNLCSELNREFRSQFLLHERSYLADMEFLKSAEANERTSREVNKSKIIEASEKVGEKMDIQLLQFMGNRLAISTVANINADAVSTVCTAQIAHVPDQLIFDANKQYNAFIEWVKWQTDQWFTERGSSSTPSNVQFNSTKIIKITIPSGEFNRVNSSSDRRGNDGYFFIKTDSPESRKLICELWNGRTNFKTSSSCAYVCPGISAYCAKHDVKPHWN